MSVFKLRSTTTEKDETRLTISVGRVVDTNDPVQMGRLRVFIPGLDRNSAAVGDIPFAMYCSPFAGHQHVQSRGRSEQDFSDGPVAYGLFSIPKVGTDVLVAFIDGNPQHRIWFGALYGSFLTNTLPHGRYGFAVPGKDGTPDGPFTSAEQPLQPLYNNLTEAFKRVKAIASNDDAPGLDSRKNFEWRSRGADYQAAGLGLIQKDSPLQVVANVNDDRHHVFTEEDNNQFKQGDYTQGYGISRIEPDLPYDETLVDGGRNLDPQTHSWTTPGFHSISMDDRAENCRIRFRTTGGHQILIDDTNERIYVSTAKGNNWVELDENGNIDVYSARRISIHASKDINFTTDGSFRVFAKEGIHLNSETEVRITAKQQLHFRSNEQMKFHAGSDIFIESDNSIHQYSKGSLFLTSDKVTNILSGTRGAWSTKQTLNLKAGGNILQTAPRIHLNGPQAGRAEKSKPADEKHAFFTNRVPEHEPWGRIMMNSDSTDQDSGNSFQLEFSYDDPNVGKVELGENISRNNKWHR